MPFIMTARFLVGISVAIGMMQAESLSLEKISSNKQIMTRRSALGLPLVAVLPSAAMALDMDSFMESELSKDSGPKNKDLSADEAMCRFGQPSEVTGQACVRANLSTKRQGGVDAFGTIDRGDYVKCKVYYVDGGDNGFMQKKYKCE